MKKERRGSVRFRTNGNGGKKTKTSKQKYKINK